MIKKFNNMLLIQSKSKNKMGAFPYFLGKHPFIFTVLLISAY